MSLEDHTHAVVDFVRAHEVWAAPIVGALAFGESLAFISLLLPAWAMLVAIGAVISGSGIDFWPILAAGAIGAALGDWLSYWVGLKLGPAVAHMWPLSRHPELIPPRCRWWPAYSRCRTGSSRRRISSRPSSRRRCC
jgi:membrane protein DedA with SNARE-associated domain